MKKPQLHRSNLSKWLLALFLFFGLFTFSGLAIRTATAPSRTVQTEVFVGLNQKSSKRLTYYKQKRPSNLSSLPYFGISNTWVLVAQHQHLQNLFKALAQNRNFVSLSYRLPLKTIPQSSNEAALHPTVG